MTLVCFYLCVLLICFIYASSPLFKYLVNFESEGEIEREREREREREIVQAREGQRERETQNPKQAPGLRCQHRARHGPGTHEL